MTGPTHFHVLGRSLRGNAAAGTKSASLRHANPIPGVHVDEGPQERVNWPSPAPGSRYCVHEEPNRMMLVCLLL